MDFLAFFFGEFFWKVIFLNGIRGKLQFLKHQKIPREHHGFHLFYPGNKRKIWKLYHSTDMD
jgi:hypothetical protein